MPEKTVILTHDGSLTVCKTQIDWQRDLRVTWADTVSGKGHEVEFPAEKNSLALEGLDPSHTYSVRVSRPGLVHKLTSTPSEILVQPVSTPLTVIITGSGRCGTQSLARYLDNLVFESGQPVDARHETLSEYILPLIIRKDFDGVRRILSGFGHQVEAAPYLSIVPETIEAKHIVHLTRDGRRVVQSGVNRGWYQNDSNWNKIKPRLAEDVFASSCHLWTLTNQNSAKVSTTTVRMEDLSQSPESCSALLSELEIEATKRPFPQANRGKAPSGFDAWTSGQKDRFREICGGVMNVYYPGWESEW